MQLALLEKKKKKKEAAVSDPIAIPHRNFGTGSWTPFHCPLLLHRAALFLISPPPPHRQIPASSVFGSSPAASLPIRPIGNFAQPSAYAPFRRPNLSRARRAARDSPAGCESAARRRRASPTGRAATRYKFLVRAPSKVICSFASIL